MTEPKPPIDALDEQERELARVLRALPGGEPPAALDQKILRAAANAAASSRRPRARWLASLGSIWGVGGAAAAVLALGVTWQMLDPGRTGTVQRSAPAANSSAQDSAITVDLGVANSAPAPIAATAEAAALDAQAPAAPKPQSTRPIAARAAAQEVAAPAFAPAPPAAALARDAMLSDQAAPVASAGGDAFSVSEAAAGQASAEASTKAAAETGAIGNLAAKAAAPAASAMTPAVWLAQVRKLRSEGRAGDARSSLELFHRYYPQYVIPADLAPLLRE